MAATTTFSVSIPEDLARDLPQEPAERQLVLELGLREWRVRRALDSFRRGEGTLAHAARRAGVSLREMIALAYAHGLAPRSDPAGPSAPLTLDDAARL